MTEKSIEKIKTTQVSYEEFTNYEFQPPATFYIMDSLQNYIFVHTSQRSVAQEVVDEMYGKGRYTVRAAKQQKSKSKREDGGYSAVGSSTRKCYVKKN